MRGNHRRVTLRHARPASKRRRIARRAGAVLIVGASLAGYGLSGVHAATVHHATRRQIMAACERGQTMGIGAYTYACVSVIRYSPDDPECRRWQAGTYGLIVGDGAPILIRCDRDGTVYVWGLATD
jgi:hypothetical protein